MIRTAYVTFSTFFAGVLYATLSIDVVVTTLYAANSVRFITYTLKSILVKLQFPPVAAVAAGSMALLEPGTRVTFKDAVPGYPELLGASGRIEALMTCGTKGVTKYHVRPDEGNSGVRVAPPGTVVVAAPVVRKATKAEEQAAKESSDRSAGKRRREGSPAPAATMARTPVTAPTAPVVASPPSQEAATSFPPVLPTVFRETHVGDWVGTQEAKSRYWLSTADLKKLDVRSLGGGVGIGRPQYFYDPEDLEKLAILTHGPAAYEVKRAKRAKRNANRQAAASAHASAPNMAIAHWTSALPRPLSSASAPSSWAPTQDPYLAAAARRYGGMKHIPLGTEIGGIPWGM